MRLANPPKALIALVALICITTLMALGRVDSDSGLGVIGLIVGYAIGNGIAAKDGDPNIPIFDTRNPRRRKTDQALADENAGLRAALRNREPDS